MAPVRWPDAVFQGEVRPLSDAAVLALVLRASIGRGEVVAAALARTQSLVELARASPFELACLPGVAPRDAARVAAAFELGRRAALAASDGLPILSDSTAVARLARPLLEGLVHEELWVFAVDALQRVRASGCVARGGLHGLHVAVRDPLRFALRHGASAIIVVHNHPSGDPSPSLEDLAFTDRLAAAAETVGTPLLDHVIVAGAAHRSLLDDGIIGRRDRAALAPVGDRARGTRSAALRSGPPERAGSARSGAPLGARGRAPRDPS